MESSGLSGWFLVRSIDLDTCLFDERRHNNEEDQHDEHDVEHRRQINLCSVLFLSLRYFRMASSTYTTGSMIRRQLICQELLLPVGNSLEIRIGKQPDRAATIPAIVGIVDRSTPRHGLGITTTGDRHHVKDLDHARYGAEQPQQGAQRDTGRDHVHVVVNQLATL